MKYVLHRGLRKLLEISRSRGVALSLLASAVMLVFFQFVTAMNLFVIFDGETLTVHQSYASNAEEALAEAGVSIHRDDFVFLPEAPQGGVVEIYIERSHSISIDAYGETQRMSTLGTTVSEALTRAGLTPAGQDVVEPDLSAPIENGMTISIWRRETHVETVVEEIPFEIRNVPLDSLPKGEEEVAQQGVPGEKTYYYEISMRNGSEIDRRLIDEKITLPSRDTIIHYGTLEPPPSPSPSPPPPPPSVRADAGVDAEGGVLVTSSGEELRYTKALKVTATAYSTEGRNNKRTATGTIARVGAIAVDPSVIPLGTRVYVEIPGGQWVYGFATCEDTGSAIKGYIIDLFFDTMAECYRFGRRNANVYILE